MYSVEVRKLTLIIYKKMKSMRKVEDLTNISKSSISRWNRRIVPLNREEKNKHIVPVIINAIELTLKLKPFLSVNEIQYHLKKHSNLDCSSNLIRIVMKKEMNLVYKKPKFVGCPNKEIMKKKTLAFCTDFKKLVKNIQIKLLHL